MKEKVTWIIRITVIILVVLCIVAIVWYFLQRRELQNQSVNFLKQYNQLAHPQDIYNKKNKELTKKEIQQWESDVEHQLCKFMKKDSDVYQRIYQEIKEIFLDEMEMEPEQRVKSMNEKIQGKKSCKITTDTAEIQLTVIESSVKYNGSKGNTDTDYTFYYIKEDGQWILTNVNISFSDI